MEEKWVGLERWPAKSLQRLLGADSAVQTKEHLMLDCGIYCSPPQPPHTSQNVQGLWRWFQHQSYPNGSHCLRQVDRQDRVSVRTAQLVVNHFYETIKVNVCVS